MKNEIKTIAIGGMLILCFITVLPGFLLVGEAMFGGFKDSILNGMLDKM